MKYKKIPLISFLSVIILVSCAFDIVHVKQIPTKFTKIESEASAFFVLKETVRVGIGTGFSTKLHKNTKWICVGFIPQGNVFNTRDQIVTVEGSNIFEAFIVMHTKYLVGFYLPVEGTYCPLNRPIKLKIEEMIQE